MNIRRGETLISLVQGDITRQRVDAVVNAANSGLLGGSGVDGAIHRVGGPEIMAECRVIRRARGGCPAGDAVATTAGNLRAKRVIHTVGPVYRDGRSGEPETLRSAVRRSLEVAMDEGARTVAFPSISTGAYGYPIREAAVIALGEILRTICEAPEAFDEIRVVLFSAGDYEVYRAALERAAGS